MKKALKSIISTALVMVVAVSIMMTFVVGITSDVSIAKQSDKELSRIKSYKLFPKSCFKKMGKAITDKEYYSAIKKYIKPYGAAAQKRFDREIKSRLTDGNKLTYQDVLILTYLTAISTKTNYLTQYNTSNYYYMDKRLEEYWEYDRKCNETYKTQNNLHYFFYFPWGSKQLVSDWDIQAYTLFFCCMQTSQLSGIPVFDMVTKPNLSFISSNCPRNAAVRMLGRLYEASKPVKWDMRSDLAKKIYQNGADRKTTILESASVYDEKAEKYFVSTSGDDGNDGRTEETPWRTLERASTELKPGSVVLFKRGDVWRGEGLLAKPGVTYSAYGTGPKPAFYGDGEDAGNPENWILCEDISSDTKKIWKYKKELYDVGGIIFNNGASYAKRIQGWWKKTKWVDFKNDKYDLTPDYALKKDLTYISLPDLNGLEYPIAYGITPRKGDVYLRCDKGNPAELYEAVNFEISAGDKGSPVTCMENCTIDNIAVKYFGELAITSDFSDEVTQGMSMEGVTVTNCEVGYGGNVLWEIPNENHDEQYLTTGDGIYGLCNGATIKNNYIHDVDCGGVRVENSGSNLDRNIDLPMLATGNLLERNGQGIWISSDRGNVNYNKISITDNMILDNGHGWVNRGGWEAVCISTDDIAETDCKEMIISNNVVYNAKGAIYDSIGKNIKLEDNQFYLEP